ncbi:MAG: ABC transporter permease subunit [Elusimicrobia bacterium]|nr:ABC transporter permease subunit [Elusimicrobiota bacterium]
MLIKIIEIIILLAAAYAFTHKLLPWVFIKIGKKLGFKMEMTPIWAKRIRRFKTIKRGYYSFIIITTLFVLSLFLELYINDKPLAIRYDENISFPALKEWGNKVLFFVDIPNFDKKSDFGQVGNDNVDYRLFAKTCGNPDFAKEAIKKKNDEIRDLKEELRDIPTLDKYSDEDDIADYNDLKTLIANIEKEIGEVRRNADIFTNGKAWVIMPMYPYSPHEHILDLPQRPPNKPYLGHPMGTDDSGADVLAQLFYGFRISLSFALIVAFIGYSVGVVVGGVMGYFGGWVDIALQRFIEIWGSIPFLFTIMIIASIIQPGFILLAILLVCLRSWIGITYYIRGEFYREKAKDYVQAAIAMGATEWSVMMKHILPNSLVPLVTFAPFGIVSYIGLLVSLDYLGFGLPVGTPSWGSLLDQGMKYIKYYPHLIIIPSVAFAFTLFTVVMIGEAIREAFDPKVFSRLR